MNKFKKNISLIIATLLFIFSATLVSSNQNNKVEATTWATKYGRGNKFTIPKSMRGTWVSKSKRSAYKKIKLTAHTIVFTPKEYRGKEHTGKWNLYHMDKNTFDKAYHTEIEVKANKYANKYRWLATRKDSSKEFFFKRGWLLDEEASFILRKTSSKNVIRFLNTSFENNYYRK